MVQYDEDGVELEDELEDEWEELPQVAPGTRQIAVECKTCGAVSKFKYHTPRSVFSFDCPKCRKREAMRIVQRKRYQRTKVVDAAKLKAARKRLISRIDVMINDNAERIADYRVRVNIQGYQPNGRTVRIFQQRVKIDAFYKHIRATMTIDINRGDFKPFLHYMNDEKSYAKFFGDERLVAATGEPTTDEPEVVRTLEP